MKRYFKLGKISAPEFRNRIHENNLAFVMDTTLENLIESESNGKITDSAYATSCSNSQTRRSHSTKSTLSGSHSSGSSGYGGKPVTPRCSNDLQEQQQPSDAKTKTECKPKKKKKSVILETMSEDKVKAEVPDTDKTEDIIEDSNVTSLKPDQNEEKIETEQQNARRSQQTSQVNDSKPMGGFSCTISLQDGIIMNINETTMGSLELRNDQWVGRSFFDFVHPKDHKSFSSLISDDASLPKNEHCTVTPAPPPATEKQITTFICRIRQYKALSSGYGIRDRPTAYLPFKLKISFKNVNNKDGTVAFLLIQATPYYSAFKVPFEKLDEVATFMMRHAVDGNLDYIDPASVPYLGYLPQDFHNKNVLHMYHIEDLIFLQFVYEAVVKEGKVPRGKPYRMMIHNGDYIKIETEWSTKINPWSKKIEFVIATHHIIQGPANPDVFQPPDPKKVSKITRYESMKAQLIRDSIIRIMNEVLTKPAAIAKRQIVKRCQELAGFMEDFGNEPGKNNKEGVIETPEEDTSYLLGPQTRPMLGAEKFPENDTFLLGGISPHHEYDDSDSSIGTGHSYNQINYKETLQRFFDSHEPYTEDGHKATSKSKSAKSDARRSMSPMAHYSGSSMGLIDFSNSFNEDNHLMRNANYKPMRLSENLLAKHNAEMEKYLTKMYLEKSSKTDREKPILTIMKKKDHIARCNAMYQPTSQELQNDKMTQGLKRSYKTYSDGEPRKIQRHPRRRASNARSPATPSPKLPSPSPSNASPWPSTVNNINTFYLAPAVSQPVPNMSHPHDVPPMTGMIPMYYAPAPAPHMHYTCMHAPTHAPTHDPTHAPTYAPMHAPMHTPTHAHTYAPTYAHTHAPTYVPTHAHTHAPTHAHTHAPTHAHTHAPTHAHTHAPTHAHTHAPTHPRARAQPYPNPNAHPYAPPCRYPQSSPRHKRTPPQQPMPPIPHVNMIPDPSTPFQPPNVPCIMYGHVDFSNTFTLGPQMSYPLQQSLMPYHKTIASPNFERRPANSSLNNNLSSQYEDDSACTSSDSQNTPWKKKLTYSSVRSSLHSNSTRNTDPVFGVHKMRDDSFMKNESFSNYNSDERTELTDGESSYSSYYSSLFRPESSSAEDTDARKEESIPEVRYMPRKPKIIKRRMDPPWMDQVRVTSELVYRYQIQTKSLEEVLLADKEKMKNMTQPALVNEQLEQLYLDLELEGVTARLTLEECITSSGSSGEETTLEKALSKKKKYSKLAMIYEEDAPLPPLSDEEGPKPLNVIPSVSQEDS